MVHPPPVPEQNLQTNHPSSCHILLPASSPADHATSPNHPPPPPSPPPPPAAGFRSTAHLHSARRCRGEKSAVNCTFKGSWSGNMWAATSLSCNSDSQFGQQSQWVACPLEREWGLAQPLPITFTFTAEPHFKPQLVWARGKEFLFASSVHKWFGFGSNLLSKLYKCVVWWCWIYMEDCALLILSFCHSRLTCVGP